MRKMVPAGPEVPPSPDASTCAGLAGGVGSLPFDRRCLSIAPSQSNGSAGLTGWGGALPLSSATREIGGGAPAGAAAGAACGTEAGGTITA